MWNPWKKSSGANRPQAARAKKIEPQTSEGQSYSDSADLANGINGMMAELDGECPHQWIPIIGTRRACQCALCEDTYDPDEVF